jgi:hypothetical protein
MRPLAPELEAKIDEVKLWMLEGDQDRVAAKSRKSREWVNKVLNKKAFNAQIIESAIEVMEENKARFQCNTSKMKIA